MSDSGSTISSVAIFFALTAIGSAAFAGSADGVSDTRPVMAAASGTTDWSGAYAGLSLGYSIGESETTNSIYPVFTVDLSGGLAGAFAGYRWQGQNSIYGVEAEVMFGGVDGMATTSGGSEEYFLDEKYRAGLRGFYGVPIGGNTFAYGTAGVSVVELEQNYITSTTTSEMLTGYSAGIGVQHRFDTQWGMKAEVIYSDHGSVTFQCSVCGPSDNDYRNTTVTLGLFREF